MNINILKFLIPAQFTPLPTNPVLHLHVNEPTVLVHVALVE